ncbi:Hypothetical protein, putative [Bodo saltans]|uniref:Uncharacterized protein n=1 Tax=Bodo saltans TaxID=75058 RepID=A0A0S4JIW9_BODSA|nr:Hypothetical protein, putative [Bodo saltans]|eukprot:CUG91405.1 Hypothetical protein, putative [Bodo saltans]
MSQQLPPNDGMSADEMWDYLAQLCLLFVFPEEHECGLAATLSRSKNRSWTSGQPFSRVSVYAKYGPGVRVEDGESTMDHTTNSQRLLSQVRLKSGGQGKLLQPHELKQLVDEEKRSFLCEVYNGGDGVTTPIAGAGFHAVSAKNNSHKPFSSRYASEESRMSRTSLRSMDPSRPIDDPNAASVLSLRSTEGSQRKSAAGSIPEAARHVVAPNTGATALHSSVYGELMNRRNPLCYEADQISKDELRAVLANGRFPSKEKDGKPLRWSTLADAMSTCLLQERQRRINALKCSVPSLSTIRQDPRVTNRQSVYFYSRTHPKVRSIRRYDNPQDVLVALHRYAYQVSDVNVAPAVAAAGAGANVVEVVVGRGKPSAAQLTNNVKCLRTDFVADPLRPGWNATSCMTGTHGPGSSKIVQARRQAPCVEGQ